MFIQFKKNVELNDRIYLAGQSYELGDEQAAELIASGAGVEARPVVKEAPAEDKSKKNRK